MSTEQTLYVVKILLKHISEHPEDAGVVASGALSMLDEAPISEAEHDTKKKTNQRREHRRRPNRNREHRDAAVALRSIQGR